MTTIERIQLFEDIALNNHIAEFQEIVEERLGFILERNMRNNNDTKSSRAIRKNRAQIKLLFDWILEKVFTNTLNRIDEKYGYRIDKIVLANSTEQLNTTQLIFPSTDNNSDHQLEHKIKMLKCKEVANISDHHWQMLRNEGANIPSVLYAIKARKILNNKFFYLTNAYGNYMSKSLNLLAITF